MRGRRIVQGSALVVVIVTLIGLTVAGYRGAFDDGIPVTLKVDRAGSQLNERSDVKIRGLMVGEVTAITTTGAADGADVALLLDRDLAAQIPAGVSARILPKTLFGEKFVELVYPPGTTPSSVADPIQPGAVIRMDRSREAAELDRALDSLLPLLQAVEPQKVSTTLSSVSMALDGRGERLGDTLVRLQGLLHDFNPALPELQRDIGELAVFSGNLADAAPDLLDALEGFSTTSRTVVEQRTDLHDLLVGLAGGADDLREFLAANGENTIDLADSTKPTLESLARYAPEFPCLFGYLAEDVGRLNDAFQPDSERPGLHITLEVVVNRGKYLPNQDEPRYADDRGPRCYPQTVPFPQYPPDGPFRDGSVSPQAYQGMSLANSASEQRMVAELLGLSTGMSPAEIPSWSTVLVGPLLRGSEVSFT